jgi:hypothetical protein
MGLLKTLGGWLHPDRAERPDSGMTYEDLESQKDLKERQLSGASEDAQSRELDYPTKGSENEAGL